jgi:hypothetical protein
MKFSKKITSIFIAISIVATMFAFSEPLQASNIYSSGIINQNSNSTNRGVPSLDIIKKYSLDLKSIKTATDIAQSKLDALSIYNNFITLDPNIFLYGTDYLKPVEGCDDQMITYIQNKALDITKNAATPAQKIFAVVQYVATNIYYDMDYFYGYKSTVFRNPYDCLVNELTVCDGYARTCKALLQCLNIPCVYVQTIWTNNVSHAFNCAYDGSRWILFDSTWCTNNHTNLGVRYTNPPSYDEWYDFSIEKANNEGMYYHVIDTMELNINNGVLESFPASTQMTSFDMPNSVTSIGSMAFYKCTNLTSIDMPNTVKSIGYTAFSHCDGLTDIYIPDSVTSISVYAFEYCGGLKNVRLSNNLTSVNERTFDHCTALTSISFPASVTSIGPYAFGYCTSLDVAYFYGNAPTAATTCFGGASSGFKIYYSDTSTGFTNPWNGYAADTFIPTPTPVPTETPTPTVTPANSPTATPSPTVTPTNSPTATPSPTVTPTNSPTAAPSVTGTPKPTVTVKPTPKPTPAPIHVKSVKLNKNKLKLSKGKTYKLIAKISPSNAKNKKVTWRTGSYRICTVTSTGIIRGIKKGTVNIYVYTADGKKSAKCKVTVSA